MAEPTKVKIYNFGDRKLDYGKYLTNLENNVESYLQNQRDTEGWDDNRVQEFRNSFGEILSNFRSDYQGEGTRFSTNQMGSIIDTQGALNNTDADDFYYNKKGEQIDRATYDALKDKKKRKYSTFEANREVAEYFRRIGSYMKDYEDTTEKFDISKHGFNAWLMNKEAPGGTFNYQNYWDLDPVDKKTGKRGTAKREEVAAKWMEEYLKEMKDKTFNFEGNKTFSSMDDYLKRGNEVLAEWKKSGWDAQDRINAQRLGVDNDFVTKFFGTEGDPNLSAEQNAEAIAQKEEQAKLEAEKKSEEDKQTAYRKWVDEQVAAHTNMKYPYSKTSPYYANLYSWDKYYKNGQPTAEYDKMLGNLVIKMTNGHYKAVNQMNDQERGENLGNMLNQYVNNLYNPKFNLSNIPVNHHYMYLIQLLNSHYALDLGDGSYYIPSTKESNTALIFDSNAKTFYHTFIGDLADIWELRKKAYWNKINGTSPNAAYYEEGGIIKAQDGAALLRQAAIKYFADRTRQKLEQLQTKAAAKNRTIEQLEAAERKAHTPFAGFRDDNTWSTEEYARLTAAGADITAAIAAFVPGGGTVVSGVAGIGSTIANAVADKADDSVSTGQWWKNLGMNLGMDVLGLIPGAGAAGKFTKILRNIGRTIPRVIAAVGTYGAFKNSDAILASLKKSLSNPEELTVEDWQNIAQGIGIATGLAAGTGRHLQRKAKDSGSTTDFAAIRLRSKTNPKIVENKIVGAKTARDLRAAKTNDEIREILYRDNPWLKDNYDLDLKGGLYGKELTWKRPTWAEWFPVGTRENLAKVYEVRRDAKGNLFGYNGKWGSDLALYRDGSINNFGKVRRQSYQNTGKGTLLSAERQSYLDDLGRIRKQVGTAENKQGTRRKAVDEDFEKAYQQSRTDLQNTPNKATLVQLRKDIRKQYEEQQKPFRDKHGSTSDITNRLNASRTLRGSTDYQNAINQHATLTQEHANIIAKNQPIIDSNKRQIEQIDKDLLYLNDQRSSSSKEDRDLANSEIRRLNRLRQKLETEINDKTAEISAAEVKVKDNKDRIDAGSDTRIEELTNLEKQSKEFDLRLSDIDAEISRLEKLGGAHTPSYVELLDKRRKDGKITFTDERNKPFTVDAIRAMRLAGIKKNGGILNAVEKFQHSGKIKSPMRDVQNPGEVSWYQDMFWEGLNRYTEGHEENWFDKWKIGDPVYNPERFNQLQTDWYNNFKATGYEEGSNKAIYNQGVWDRQPLWEATGGNEPIGFMLANGKLVGNGGTDDKPDPETKKFGRDGVFGQQEFLRHAGRVSDWEGEEHQKALAKLNEKLALRGLVYKADETKATDMMMLYPLKKEETTEKVVEKGKKSQLDTPGDKKKPEFTKPGGDLFGKAKQLLSDPDLIATGRLFNTLSQIEREKNLDKTKPLYLKEVAQPHLYVRKDFMALQNARKAQQMLARTISQPITPDAGQWSTYAADQFVKLLDYGLQGNQLADAKGWETSDASKAQEIKNLENRVTNSNDNLYQAITKIHNDITSEEVADYKKTNAINNRLYELQARGEQDRLEAKAAQKKADALLLDNDVTFNLNKYAQRFGISQPEVDIWNKVQAGTAPSKLSAEEQKLWESVYRKVNYGKGLLSAEQSGAYVGDFALARSMANKSTKSTSPTAHVDAPSYVNLSKEGSKLQAKSRIKVAKIRERIKNADRAARAAEKNLDRVQRTVESINKRMYGVKR